MVNKQGAISSQDDRKLVVLINLDVLAHEDRAQEIVDIRIVRDLVPAPIWSSHRWESSVGQ